MKNSVKIFFKILILSSLSFLMVLYLFDNPANTKQIIKIIIQSLFFGFFIALIFSQIFKYRIKKSGYSLENDDLFGLTSKKIIETDLSQNEIYDLLKSSKRFKKSKFKTDDLKIIIKKGISWLSWGEIIKINFLKNKKIKIESKPAFPATVVDYGINFENVDYIIKLINNKKYDS